MEIQIYSFFFENIFTKKCGKNVTIVIVTSLLCCLKCILKKDNGDENNINVAPWAKNSKKGTI